MWSVIALVAWAIIGLPVLYAQNDTARGRPPIAKEQAEPTKGHNGNATPDGQPTSVVLTRGSPTNPLYVETTCDDQDRNAECNKGWWQKLWTDPVATFTGALFLATFFQVIFTMRAFIESRDANEAARAAEQNTANSLVASNRPYVFVRDYRAIELRDESGNFTAWQAVVVWENSGTTPTIGLKTWISWGFFDAPLPSDYPFPDMGEKPGDLSISIIPPRGEITTNAFILRLPTALELSMNEKFMYLWGWAEYRDIFPNTPNRRTEFCVRIVVTELPTHPRTLMVEFRHHSSHNNTT